MKWLLLLALAAYAPQHAGTPITPELEAKAHTIGKTIRCAVCQGLSVADSPSPMAQSMMDRVRELVTEGKSEAEIHAYFVERYGEWIVLDPDMKGLNFFIWIGPGLLVGLGLAWSVSLMSRWRKEPDDVPLPSDQGLVAKDRYEQRLLAELED